MKGLDGAREHEDLFFIFIQHLFIEKLPCARYYSKAVREKILPKGGLYSSGRRQSIHTKITRERGQSMPVLCRINAHESFPEKQNQ